MILCTSLRLEYQASRSGTRLFRREDDQGIYPLAATIEGLNRPLRSYALTIVMRTYKASRTIISA